MIEFEFNYKEVLEWPPLAWLSICDQGSFMIRVYHGRSLEVQPGWFCEAVWDSEFQAGNFDMTDCVFGTGARLRSNVHFVSSGSTVDRLHVISKKGRSYVSNSLPCILQATDAVLDPAYRGYVDFFTSIRSGFKRHLPKLPLVDEFVRLVYFKNLIWDGTKLTESLKPFTRYDLRGFDDYVCLMRNVLRRIRENLTDHCRSTPYTWLGTLSRGYDSAACVALAKRAGLQHVLTFNESRPGIADDGNDIARILGVDCIVIDRLGWQGKDLVEPAFLVADGQGKEVSVAAAASLLDKTVLLTGHGGDYIWKREPDPLSDDLQRGGYSGLSMSEYRLHSGFIHFPLPFINMRQVGDIARISQSKEMMPWDTKGNYSRPICRRLVEEEGVPRDQFGVNKTGNSVRFLIGHDAWSKTGKRTFLKWLWINRKQAGLSGLRWGKACSAQLVLGLFLRKSLPWPLNRIQHRTWRLSAVVRRYRLEDMAFIWATECIRKHYKR